MSIDIILSMSWDQIEFCARSILRHKAQMATMILEPIMTGLGAKKKGKNKTQKRNHQKSDRITREEKDQHRLAQLQMMGFPVTEV